MKNVNCWPYLYMYIYICFVSFVRFGFFCSLSPFYEREFEFNQINYDCQWSELRDDQFWLSSNSDSYSPRPKSSWSSGTVINWQISRGPRAISISFESGPNKLLHNSSSPKEAVLIPLFMGHPITFWPLQEQLPFCQKPRHYHFPYWVCCVHKSRALL